MDAINMELLLSNYRGRLGPIHTPEAATEAARQLKVQNYGVDRNCHDYQQRSQRQQELERFADLLAYLRQKACTTLSLRDST